MGGTAEPSFRNDGGPPALSGVHAGEAATTGRMGGARTMNTQEARPISK
jgi:hypothetical protein